MSFWSFLGFDMGSSVLCDSDYVDILEENDAGELKSISKFCGEDQPANFYSSKNQVKVHHVQTMNSAGTGWKIKFLGVQWNPLN
jgi:hypothetical protein